MIYTDKLQRATDLVIVAHKGQMRKGKPRRWNKYCNRSYLLYGSTARGFLTVRV